jgi:hypothetical protein
MEQDMSDSLASPWRERLLMLALVLGVIIRLGFAAPAGEPPRVDARQAEAWMADALPGVGVKRRHDSLEALRRGDIEALPKQARETARACFIFPEEVQP